MATTKRTSKRDNGEGSAPYQVADGRWRCDVTVGWERREDGTKRRIRKVVYGATEREAKAARNDVLRKRDNGELAIGDAVTLSAWLDYWLANVAPRRCEIRTLEGYRTYVEHWIKPTIGHVRLRDLEPEHVELLHDAMRRGKARERSNGRVIPARPLSETSVLQAHAILSRALEVAVQRQKIMRNVARLVDRPAAAVVEVDSEKFYTPDEAKAVLAAAKGTPNEARWSVGLAIGARQGEVLGLLWDEVDLDKGSLTIRRQLQRRRRTVDGQPGQLVLAERVKGDSKRKRQSRARTITLPAQLVAILRAHRKAQLETRLALGDEWTGSPLGDLVFANADGSAIDPRRDWAEWGRLVQAAGVRYVNPHGSRHTAATIMLLAGVDVRVVQDVIGHTDPAFTQRVYQHVLDEMKSQATDAVGAVLWG